MQNKFTEMQTKYAVRGIKMFLLHLKHRCTHVGLEWFPLEPCVL